MNGAGTFWQRATRGGRRISAAGTLLLLAPFLALLLIAFAYPLFDLLTISFLEPAPTTAHYERVFTTPVYTWVFLRTLWISFVTACAALVLGFPVAYLMTRLTGVGAMVLVACVLLPFWSSVLVRTAAWVVMLGREGLVNQLLQAIGLTDEPLQLLYTQGAVVIAMTHVLMPFMILPIYGALRNIPDDYMRAASLLGASRPRAFYEVLLPLSLPGVWSGFLMVFLTALGFFVTPALLGSPQEQLIATLISQQVRETLDWPFAAALVSVLTVVVLLITLAFGRVININRAVGGFS